MTQTLQIYDYLIIAGYFIVVLSASYGLAKKMNLTKDFFAAGGNMPWWLAAISLFMASFSALTFVMYAELSYNFGIISILLYQISVPALILAGFTFAQRWRRTRVETPVQFLEKRFNFSVRQAIAWTGIPLRIMDDALKIFSTAIFLYAGLKLSILSLPVAICIIGVILIVYAFLGGQRGVIVIDFVQFIILLIAVLLLLPLTIMKIGGIGAFIAAAPDGFFDPRTGPYRGFNIIAFVVLFAMSLNSTWSLVQKYNCVRDEKEAKKVAWAVAGLNFIGPMIFFIPAMLSRVLLPELENAKYAYAELAFTILPTGLMGVMVAGMFSATVSTMGSEFNVLAGILTNDVYKRVFKPKASEKELMLVARIATVIVGVLIIAMALLVSALKGISLFDIMMKAFGALLPATALPMLAGLVWRRINARGALTGLITGIISGISLILLNLILVGIYSEAMAQNSELNYWLRQGWDSASILFNICITGFAMYLGTRLSPTQEKEHLRVKSFFQEMDKPVVVRSDIDFRIETAANFRMISFMLLGFGTIVGLTGFILGLVQGFTQAAWLNLSVSLLLLLLGSGIYLISHRAETKKMMD
jgi:solute:Na+ symporter, SSS family